MATTQINPDRANRAIWKFIWLALATTVGIGIIWFVATAMNDPASRADSTAVGNAASTTPGATGQRQP